MRYWTICCHIRHKHCFLRIQDLCTLAHGSMKHFDLTVTGLRPIEEAIITDGGVSLEIDPKNDGLEAD